jgi:hypothetical protein
MSGNGSGPIAMLTFANIPVRGLAYLYRDPHRGIVQSVREHQRLIDSMFIRLQPYAIEGTWFPWSRFAGRFDGLVRAMPSAPAPDPPAPTPPDPAFRFRTV